MLSKTQPDNVLARRLLREWLWLTLGVVQESKMVLFVATICKNRPHSTDDSYMCAFGRLQTMMRSVSIGGRKGQVLGER